jgi:hypothetical protein
LISLLHENQRWLLDCFDSPTPHCKLRTFESALDFLEGDHYFDFTASALHKGLFSLLPLSMNFSVARCAEGDQILGSVIAQSAPRLNVMDLKIFHPPALLTAPAVSF